MINIYLPKRKQTTIDTHTKLHQEASPKKKTTIAQKKKTYNLNLPRAIATKQQDTVLQYYNKNRLITIHLFFNGVKTIHLLIIPTIIFMRMFLMIFKTL